MWTYTSTLFVTPYHERYCNTVIKTAFIKILYLSRLIRWVLKGKTLFEILKELYLLKIFPVLQALKIFNTYISYQN